MKKILAWVMLTLLLMSCKVSRYETRESAHPDNALILYFMRDRHHVFVHQGDREFLFDSVKLVGTAITGRLREMKKAKESFPLPDTTMGEHPWAWKKKAPWMKAAHFYVHDTIDLPMGTIYFLPEDLRVVRSFVPVVDEHSAGKIGEDIAVGILKAILLAPFAALGNKLTSEPSHTSYSSGQRPRGSSGTGNSSAIKAKIRSFPTKIDQH